MNGPTRICGVVFPHDWGFAFRLALCTSLIISSSATMAQDPIPSADAAKTNSTDDRRDDQANPKDETARLPDAAGTAERHKKAWIGLAAVGGIAILGVGFIAVTMVWARRLRRLARDLGPPQRTVGNDFWFLKPPKPNAMEPNIAESHRPPHSPPSSEQTE